jgi:hypothetical protein
MKTTDDMIARAQEIIDLPLSGYQVYALMGKLIIGGELQITLELEALGLIHETHGPGIDVLGPRLRRRARWELTDLGVVVLAIIEQRCAACGVSSGDVICESCERLNAELTEAALGKQVERLERSSPEMATKTGARRFVMDNRGHVLGEGVRFSDGTTVMRWFEQQAVFVFKDDEDLGFGPEEAWGILWIDPREKKEGT